MGWAMLLLLALVAAAALWLLGFPRRLWTIPATALTLGAAGYAWQGSPGLAGHSVAAQQEKGDVDPGLVALREAMFGRYNMTWATFAQADAMTRIGARDSAARAMLIGTRRSPGDAGMWTGLGSALAESDGNLVSPSSRFAFDRAMALSPQHPGPPFFLGLAYVRAGQFAEARQWWARAVELSPEGAAWRPELVARLELLDRFLAAQAGQQISPPAEREGQGAPTAP